MTKSKEELRAIINAQTGQIRWPELQRHFARGNVIKVNKELDLIEVSVAVIGDDNAQVNAWMQENKITKANDDDARDWYHRDPTFWAVVVAPWVLIQEIPENK